MRSDVHRGTQMHRERMRDTRSPVMSTSPRALRMHAYKPACICTCWSQVVARQSAQRLQGLLLWAWPEAIRYEVIWSEPLAKLGAR